MLFLLGLLALHLRGALADDQDQSPYSPSSTVKLFHSQTFRANEDFAMSTLRRCVPVAAVGTCLFLVFVVWSFVRCCRVKWCVQAKQSTEKSPSLPRLLTVLAFVLALFFLAVCLYGIFGADPQQARVLSDLPAYVSTVASWKSTSLSKLNVLLNNAVATTNLARTITTNASICGTAATGVDCSMLNTMYLQQNSYATNVNPVISRIQSITALEDIEASVRKRTDTANAYRRLVFLLLLTVPLAIVLLQLALSLANTHSHIKSQPRKNACGKVVTVLTAIFFLLFMLLFFYLAAVFLFSSSGLADYCMDPEQNTLALLGSSDSVVVYYLTCVSNTNQVNPFDTQLRFVNQTFTVTQSYLSRFNSSAQRCNTASACRASSQAVASLRTSVQSIQTALGTTGTGTAAGTGVFGQVGCVALNGLIQAAFHVACDDAMVSVAALFFIFILLACFMVLLECIRRKVPWRDTDEYDDTPVLRDMALRPLGGDPHIIDLDAPFHDQGLDGDHAFGGMWPEPPAAAGGTGALPPLNPLRPSGAAPPPRPDGAAGSAPTRIIYFNNRAGETDTDGVDNALAAGGAGAARRTPSGAEGEHDDQSPPYMADGTQEAIELALRGHHEEVEDDEPPPAYDEPDAGFTFADVYRSSHA